MKKALSLIAGILFAGLVLTGCGNSSSENSADAPEKNQAAALNVAYQPVVGFSPIFILRDNGAVQTALKEAGYDVEVNYTLFESGPPENEAFASGLQDIGVAGNVPVVSGIAAGQNRSIIGIASNGEKTEAVLVAKDSDIQSIDDLSGKKIGLVVGSIANNFIYSLGVPADAEIVNLSTGEQEAALQSGQVDAVAAWEPTMTKIQKDGVGRILADGTGVFLGENPIFGRTEYIEQNPEIVQIFLNEYKKAADELKSAPDSYAEKYSQELGIDADTYVAALANAELPVAITETDEADLQGTAEFLYDSEIISKKLNIRDYINYQFSEGLK